jgi:hypothetical protein
LESLGTSDDDVLIGWIYCIVGAGELRFYRVGSRGVEGHGWRASAVGCFGKRCTVHVAIWLAKMICGKQQATRLRNLGVGVNHCTFWLYGHGCLVLGCWVLVLECWVLGVGFLFNKGTALSLDWWKSGHTHFYLFSALFGR